MKQRRKNFYIFLRETFTKWSEQMGKTYKDRYRDEPHNEKNYRTIKMKKIKGWRKAKKKEEVEART